MNKQLVCQGVTETEKTRGTKRNDWGEGRTEGPKEALIENIIIIRGEDLCLI